MLDAAAMEPAGGDVQHAAGIHVTLESIQGAGTTVRVTVPYGQRLSLWRWARMR